jgi:hypothetical protein
MNKQDENRLTKLIVTRPEDATSIEIGQNPRKGYKWFITTLERWNKIKNRRCCLAYVKDTGEYGDFITLKTYRWTGLFSVTDDGKELIVFEGYIPKNK